MPDILQQTQLLNSIVIQICLELNYMYNSKYLKNFENMFNLSKNAAILVLRINRVQPVQPKYDTKCYLTK